MEKINGVDAGNPTINSLSNGKNEELTDSGGITNASGGYLSRLRNDTVFRKRLMHTGFVWWAFVTLVRLTTPCLNFRILLTSWV